MEIRLAGNHSGLGKTVLDQPSAANTHPVMSIGHHPYVGLVSWFAAAPGAAGERRTNPKSTSNALARPIGVAISRTTIITSYGRTLRVPAASTTATMSARNARNLCRLLPRQAPNTTSPLPVAARSAAESRARSVHTPCSASPTRIATSPTAHAISAHCLCLSIEPPLGRNGRCRS
jgi:hypothetical protein